MDCQNINTTVQSPNKEIAVEFQLVDGNPQYSLVFDGRTIIADSHLGMILQDKIDLSHNLSIVSIEHDQYDATWTQPWGECKEIRNHYNEMVVHLATNSDKYNLNILFRVFDDGIGFRYEIPAQAALDSVQILDEKSEFCLTADHRCWWIPAYWKNRYEYLYRNTNLSEIDTVHTPFTMATDDGLFLSIHEAALTDYASMTLARENGTKLVADLVPWSDGTKVKGRVPLKSPWRTIQITKSPGDLISSNLILNLNEPNKIDDCSWIRPGKYVGIWWGMHTGIYTWGSGPNHGATTERTKEYIDFAAQHGFDGILVEGWNIGWDGDWGQNGSLFRFDQPHPDFDMEYLSRYAAAKGVHIIGHHETSADVLNYESQLEDAFRYYQQHGIRVIKTGYVEHGQNIRRIDKNGVEQLEWHHGQYMVRHYRKVVQKAAEYRFMLDVHEPIKDTGIRRTYPNMMTREGARGMEYDAWSPDGGNPPDYTTILPFTRLLAGPFDFTPGIFDLYIPDRPDNRVNTTLAKMLAYYVVIYSPLHMAADLPQNYENQPAFQFILDVPVDWDFTRVLNARIGDYVTIVRKDRNSDDWYLGSITDENPRSLEIQLDFLETGREYIAEIYADAEDANWESNPLAIRMEQKAVDSETVLQLHLAPGGGQAIRFRALE